MRPEPLSGVGRLLRLLRARGMDTRGTRTRRVFVPVLCFLGLRRVSWAYAVLMLGIRLDCLRSEPRL